MAVSRFSSGDIAGQLVKHSVLAVSKLASLEGSSDRCQDPARRTQTKRWSKESTNKALLRETQVLILNGKCAGQKSYIGLRIIQECPSKHLLC